MAEPKEAESRGKFETSESIGDLEVKFRSTLLTLENWDLNLF